MGLGMNPLQTYIQKVLSIQSANLIAYWPLNETAGAVADNVQGVTARDGTYTGVTLDSILGPDEVNQAGLWDGVNDYCDIYSASLNTAFSGATGTLAAWMRVSGAGVWTDAASRYIVHLLVDGDNAVYIRKNNNNNQLRYHYEAGNIVEVIFAAQFSVDWIHVGLTWDRPGSGDAIAYLNGIQTGAAQNIAGVFFGNLNVTQTNIGSRTQPADVFDGYIAHAAIWNTPLTPAEILDLATV